MMTTMGMKKIPVILVVCVLLFSSLDVLAMDNSGVDTGVRPECCFTYRTIRLPEASVKAFQHTPRQCGTEGIVFTMRNGAKICADPAQKWVQNIIAHVRSKNA